MKKIIMIGVLMILLLAPANAMYQSEEDIMPVEVSYESDNFIASIMFSLMPFFTTGKLSHPWMCENANVEPGVSPDIQCDGTRDYCLDFCCGKGDAEACNLLVQETDTCSQDNDCSNNEECVSGNCIELSCNANEYISNHRCVDIPEEEQERDGETAGLTQISPYSGKEYYRSDGQVEIKVNVEAPASAIFGYIDIGHELTMPSGDVKNLGYTVMNDGIFTFSWDISSATYGTYSYTTNMFVDSEMKFYKIPTKTFKVVQESSVDGGSSGTIEDESYWCKVGDVCYETNSYSSSCYESKSVCESTIVETPDTTDETDTTSPQTKEVWVVDGSSCREVSVPLSYSGGYASRNECEETISSGSSSTGDSISSSGTTGETTSGSSNELIGDDTIAGMPSYIWLIGAVAVLAMILFSKRRPY